MDAGRSRKIVLTGASGTLGRVLAAGLAARYAPLVLTDIAAFPDPLPHGARFIPADLTDAAVMAELCEGASAIVHFGGINGEKPFETILSGNIVGTHTIFEAARRNGARVVYASSNHVVGFYPRDARLDIEAAPRPDGLYGVSKVFGEALGRLMVDRYGLEVVCLRIGSWKQYPTSVRELSTWISPADGVRLIAAALTAPGVGFAVVYGISANTRAWWDLAPARALGYLSVDDAEEYADRIDGADDDPDRSDPEWARLGGPFAGPAYDEPRLGRED